MSVTFIGAEKTTYRIVTGFHSFDLAFQNRKGDIGFPVRGMCQVSGYQSTGKSTVCYALGGIIAAQVGANIALTDLEEHFDPEFMGAVLGNAGFDGTVYNADGDLDHEKLEDMFKQLKTEDYAVGIVDSIGAISPVSEAEGGLEDANVGRRAMLVAKMARRSIKLANQKKKPLIVFATNHVHQLIGSRGSVTSGGVTKDYLSTTHLRLSRKEEFSDGSFIIGGKVDKNSFGFGKRVFYLFNLVGYGISPELTAVWDCVMYKKAAYANGVVKMNGASYGRLSKMMEKVNDKELFQPFIEALQQNTVSTPEDGSEAEESDG